MDVFNRGINNQLLNEVSKMIILSDFETTYHKRTKHRAKCVVCGKLINDGDKVNAKKIKEEKYYPVKGLMGFIKWQFTHVGCNQSGISNLGACAVMAGIWAVVLLGNAINLL